MIYVRLQQHKRESDIMRYKSDMTKLRLPPPLKIDRNVNDVIIHVRAAKSYKFSGKRKRISDQSKFIMSEVHVFFFFF